MAGKSIEAGKAFLKLLVNDKEFGPGLDGSIAKLNSFSKSALAIGAKLGGLGAAITAPFAGALKVFTSIGDELADMAARTNMSASALSELKFAAEQSGASLGLIERAIHKARKEGRSFEDMAAEITSIQDPIQQAEKAIELFGTKLGPAILPMLRDLPALRQQARDLGVVMSDEAAESAGKLADMFAVLKTQGTAIAIELATAVAPALMVAVDWISKGVKGVIEFIKHNQGLLLVIGALGVALTGLAAVLLTVSAASAAAAASLGYLKTALTLLGKHPYLIAFTVALAALTPLLGPLIDKLMGLSDANEQAAASAAKGAEAHRAAADALDVETEAIDAQTEALQRMKKEQEEAAKPAREIEVQAEQEREHQLRELQAELDRARSQAARFRARNPQADYWFNRGRELEEELERTRNAPFQEFVPANPNVLFSEQGGTSFPGALQPGMNFAIQQSAIQDYMRRLQLSMAMQFGLRGLAGGLGFPADNPGWRMAQQQNNIRRDFGQRGTFSGRFAGQIFGAADTKAEAIQKKHTEFLQKMEAHLAEIKRRRGARIGAL